MNQSAVLLWPYWQRAVPSLVLLFLMILTVGAENCGKPFSMPVTNVALTNGTRMRGVQIGVGSSEQALAMVPSLCVN
ncbi:unnamed protein product [Aureobasidium vineae]|uniref:Uncharacterized protein n=1 Tax=Aureobasidium vineae TaxID=2773715 RepID=A0A9N8P7J6_9PEZI|nr:unnamed protein product [Aureobasidium vineae]